MSWPLARVGCLNLPIIVWVSVCVFICVLECLCIYLSICVLWCLACLWVCVFKVSGCIWVCTCTYCGGAGSQPWVSFLQEPPCFERQALSLGLVSLFQLSGQSVDLHTYPFWSSMNLVPDVCLYTQHWCNCWRFEFLSFCWNAKSVTFWAISPREILKYFVLKI